MDELKQLLEKSTADDALKVRGFYRVNITAPNDEFTIVGDSGWQRNIITQDGLRNLSMLLGTNLTGSQISHLELCTSTDVPASNATSLTGALDSRASVTAASNGSTSLQLTATFNSSDSFVGGTSNIAGIGCFGTSSGGTLFAGNTFTSSSCGTNQNVNATYVWTFSQ